MTNSEIAEHIRKYIYKNCQSHQFVFDNCQFLTIAGSRLYGTNSEKSDYDIRGICIAPDDYWVGGLNFEQLEFKIPDLDLDIVIYDIRKYIKLFALGNPNILELIFASDYNDMIIIETKSWKNDLKKSIERLSNQNAYNGYMGYSFAQIKKMQIKQNNKTGRTDLAEEHGFDTKFAMHGFRLARQACEFLLTKEISFPRPDREELLNIRNGLIYSKDDINKCIVDWNTECDKMREAKRNSVLPEKLDNHYMKCLLKRIFYNYVCC